MVVHSDRLSIHTHINYTPYPPLSQNEDSHMMVVYSVSLYVHTHTLHTIHISLTDEDSHMMVVCGDTLGYKTKLHILDKHGRRVHGPDAAGPEHLQHPCGVAFGPRGEMLVSDNKLEEVRVYSRAGEQLQIVPVADAQSRVSFRGGLGLILAVDSDANIFLGPVMLSERAV